MSFFKKTMMGCLIIFCLTMLFISCAENEITSAPTDSNSTDPASESSITTYTYTNRTSRTTAASATTEKSKSTNIIEDDENKWGELTPY